MKAQKRAPIKLATAPFQPRTGAFAPAHLSESTRALVTAALSGDSTKQKTEEAPKPMPKAENDSPAANAENDLRQGHPETPQEPAL
ncbi:MAG: hypothetical protein WA657_23165 [Candidatus Acidiferrales bacterium]